MTPPSLLLGEGCHTEGERGRGRGHPDRAGCSWVEEMELGVRGDQESSSLQSREERRGLRRTELQDLQGIVLEHLEGNNLRRGKE